MVLLSLLLATMATCANLAAGSPAPNNGNTCACEPSSNPGQQGQRPAGTALAGTKTAPAPGNPRMTDSPEAPAVDEDEDQGPSDSTDDPSKDDPSKDDPSPDDSEEDARPDDDQSGDDDGPSDGPAKKSRFPDEPSDDSNDDSAPSGNEAGNGPDDSDQADGPANQACAASAKLPPLKCSAEAYLIQYKMLYSVNLHTGAKKTVASGVGGGGANINALGFNPLDNHLYGAQGPVLLRIGRNGKTERVARLGFKPNLGDFDTEGQYHYSLDGKAWGRVDLRPGSPKHGKVVAKGRSRLNGVIHPADWAYSPASPEWLYGVGVSKKHIPSLVRWSTKTHKWQTIFDGYGSSNLRATSFGAVMATKDGIIYASDNKSGQIFRFPIADPRNATKAGRGPKADSNDGARCALRPDSDT